MRRAGWLRVALAAGPALLAAWFVWGCGGPEGPQRAAVQGTVTLDGQPIAEGTITFYPTGDTRGPSAGGEIRDGAYSLAAAKGPVVGTCRVEIRARRKTGQTVMVGGIETEQLEQYIPARYNTRSTLTARIEPGRHSIDFPLSSQEGSQ